MLKDDLSLNFAQIGLITLFTVIAASVFQPAGELAFDKRPLVVFLPMGMCSTTLGIILFAWSSPLAMVLLGRCFCRCRFVDTPPRSVTHNLARNLLPTRNLAQSIYSRWAATSVHQQAPLLGALLVAPLGCHHVMWFQSYRHSLSTLCIPYMPLVSRLPQRYRHARLQVAASPAAAVVQEAHYIRDRCA